MPGAPLTRTRQAILLWVRLLARTNHALPQVTEGSLHLAWVVQNTGICTLELFLVTQRKFECTKVALLKLKRVLDYVWFVSDVSTECLL